jgi:hypothetical protein
MGIPVLVLGASGSGKSTALRNFEADEIGIFNVASKPLPFRKKLAVVQKPDYAKIEATLSANHLRAYAIDDSQYLMAFESFAKAKITGYGKFTDIAVSFEHLLETILFATSEDTIVYMLHHTEQTDDGHVKAKTIGKMLDSQLTIEGLFPIVLLAEVDKGTHIFRTVSDGMTPCKAPDGMLDDTMPNDLKAVDDAIRAYWGLDEEATDEDNANAKASD